MSVRERRPAGSPGEPLLQAVLFVALAGAGALALYLIHPVTSGFLLPVGPDGPVYTWLTRLAGVRGFGDVPGGGPGIPALALNLGTALRTQPVQTVTMLGPVLAVACGLAGGAVLESALGRRTARTLAAIALTSAFTAYLAGGWLANVALVAAFLAALAPLALATESWRPVALAGGLVAAGGVAHRIFLAGAVLILLIAAALGVLWALRSRERGSAPLREAAAAGGGGMVAALAIAAVSWGPRLAVDTSQDGFFRRLGLRSLLLDRFRERFLGDLVRAAVPVAGACLLGGVWAAADQPATHGRRFLLRVVLAWTAVTVGGVLVLSITGAGPPNRVLQFAFFLPLAAAAGVGVLVDRGAAGRWVAAVSVAVFVGAALVGWSRQAPAFEPGELEAVGRAAPAIRGVPAGTPLVFLVDTSEPAAAYHVTRAGNVIRAGVPATRIGDVRILVGVPEDSLAGRPTLSGDREHDAIARAYAAGVAPPRDRAVWFVLRTFNPEGYEQALAAGTEIAPGVAVLEAGDGTERAGATTPAGRGLEPLALVLLSPAALALLAAAGAGWSMWGLAGAGRRAALLASPSAGVGVAILATPAAERLGMLPGSAGSIVAVVLLAGAGYALGLRRP